MPLPRLISPVQAVDQDADPMHPLSAGSQNAVHPSVIALTDRWSGPVNELDLRVSESGRAALPASTAARTPAYAESTCHPGKFALAFLAGK